MNNIAHLIARSAAKFPENVALEMDDEQITYSEFDELIRRFRAYFETLDTTTAPMAVVLAYKSIPAIAFSQAALREGLAYTVIDPRYPNLRVAQILADCGPAILYTDLEESRLLAVAAQMQPVAVLTATKLAGSRAQTSVADIVALAPSRKPIIERAPDDMAYVLYTSGSTGVAKGVKISHANAKYSIDWAQGEFEFDSTDVMLNQAHFGFDFCVIDHFNAWNVGASVLLVPEYNSVFPVHVVDLIREERVTNLWLVPSNIISLIKQGELLRTDPSRIRRFLYGGEPFPMKYLRQVFAWMGGRNVYNLYGPTETNLLTYHRIQPHELDAEEVPLGHALAGTRLRVDTEDRGLAIQGTGEIWAQTPSVALGYTNRPDLDRERFIHAEDGLWYRTGDIGQIDADGTVWYRGRIDDMVKVRGYRIELRDIEKAVVSTPGIGEAALVVRSAEDGEKEIHAFCVADPETTEEVIRKHLSKRLPSFMIPRHFHFLQSIPYNDRGKVNGKSLLELLTP